MPLPSPPHTHTYFAAPPLSPRIFQATVFERAEKEARRVQQAVRDKMMMANHPSTPLSPQEVEEHAFVHRKQKFIRELSKREAKERRVPFDGDSTVTGAVLDVRLLRRARQRQDTAFPRRAHGGHRECIAMYADRPLWLAFRVCVLCVLLLFASQDDDGSLDGSIATGDGEAWLPVEASVGDEGYWTSFVNCCS